MRRWRLGGSERDLEGLGVQSSDEAVWRTSKSFPGAPSGARDDMVAAADA